MAECLPSSLDLRAERTFEEINQELQLQLEKYKQDFRDLTEKFLVSQATAYSLANHLQKYKCEACKGIVESVLGEKLPGEARRPAEKLAEKPTLDERLRTCDILIRSQARELTQLRQTLQNGKDDSALLKQHLKDLLTHSDLDKHQRQGFRESLSEGYRLAERLACKLSPEIPNSLSSTSLTLTTVCSVSPRMCDTLIRSQARELTQLQQTLRDGKDGPVLLSQHLEDLLTHNDLDSHQGQGFRESLFEGHWLAERLACKLSPECLPSSSDLRAERTLAEINQELQLQLEKYKQDFRDLTEKFLISQATAYSLANHLQKYKCEACKGIVESVLGEKLPGEARRPAEKLAEKPTLDERLRTCDILIRSQARELTQLRQTLQNGKDDSALLKQHLKDLLTHSDLDKHQRQGFRESLSEGYRLAERLACKLSPEIDEDEDDEQAQETPTPSMEQLVVEENEIQPDTLDECYLAASIGHHLEGSCPPSRRVSFPTEKREIFLALDVNGDTCEDSQQEPVSFPASEVPTSQAQLQKSTHVTECLQWQLDQHLDCGDSKPILGLCSTNRAFTPNPDSGNQGPLFLELDASIRMKNPPKLEGEGSTASTHEQPVCKKIKGLSGLKQKILSRKVLFGKWRLAFRFPGLQA
uniref:Uncharacterized protein n=1 Tax=Rangifer tarandus platyrhynchus TaxID=3082113 RepID=A0ACB0DSD2_RANTA|nr:unnamed protein product [Rangifer tarandus platyrhynchus]